MSIDEVRARSHRSRELSADGVKHTQKTVGAVASVHVVDGKCTQVVFENVTDTETVYARFDGTAATIGAGFPLRNGVQYAVKGGTSISLISASDQDVRILEAILA